MVTGSLTFPNTSWIAILIHYLSFNIVEVMCYGSIWSDSKFYPSIVLVITHLPYTTNFSTWITISSSTSTDEEFISFSINSIRHIVVMGCNIELLHTLRNSIIEGFTKCSYFCLHSMMGVF